MNPNMEGDFQIYISVPLTQNTLTFAFTMHEFLGTIFSLSVPREFT